MAVDYIHDLVIAVGAIELAGFAKSDMLTTDVEPLDVTAVSSTGWRSFVGGNKTGKLEMEFMQDATNASVDDTLWAYLGTADVPKSVCFGSSNGALAYLARTLPLSYTATEGKTGEIAMGRLAGASSTGPVVRGKVLLPAGTAVTSTASGTGRQLGAVSSTKSLYAALHIFSVSGTAVPTLTMKIQSDDNSGFTTPTDRITFTAATAIGYQWGSVVGAVTDDYWRVSYTISGTNPSFLALVTAGIL